MPCRESDSHHPGTLSYRVQQTIIRSQHPAFRDVNVGEENGAIVLTGQLPSYYLKQMVQTLVSTVDGVRRLDNRVQVVRSQMAASA